LFFYLLLSLVYFLFTGESFDQIYKFVTSEDFIRCFFICVFLSISINIYNWLDIDDTLKSSWKWWPVKLMLSIFVIIAIFMYPTEHYFLFEFVLIIPAILLALICAWAIHRR